MPGLIDVVAEGGEPELFSWGNAVAEGLDPWLVAAEPARLRVCRRPCEGDVLVTFSLRVTWQGKTKTFRSSYSPGAFDLLDVGKHVSWNLAKSARGFGLKSLVLPPPHQEKKPQKRLTPTQRKFVARLVQQILTETRQEAPEVKP